MVGATDRSRIDRAPVSTFWAAVVAERLGLDRATVLTLGQGFAGCSACAKGAPQHRRSAAARAPLAGSTPARLEGASTGAGPGLYGRVSLRWHRSPRSTFTAGNARAAARLAPPGLHLGWRPF